MTARLEGKVAFITGAARGQGRSHAVRMAEEGADIIAVDIDAAIDSVPYPLATADDLAETVRLVQERGRQIVASTADVRDFSALKAAVDAGVDEFGRLDIVAANAGIISFGRLEDLAEDGWRDMIDVNLTGVWHTLKAAIPHLRAGGRGGSIAITSSSAGIKADQNIGHYGAAKTGLIGLVRTAALELAADRIRVNSVHPTTVDTAMVHNSAMYALFAPDMQPEERTRENLAQRFEPLSALPVPWIDPVDVSNAVIWLASDEARYITGVALPIDAGDVLK